eukprot:gene9423-242_t
MVSQALFISPSARSAVPVRKLSLASASGPIPLGLAPTITYRKPPRNLQSPSAPLSGTLPAARFAPPLTLRGGCAVSLQTAEDQSPSVRPSRTPAGSAIFPLRCCQDCAAPRRQIFRSDLPAQ